MRRKRKYPPYPKFTWSRGSIHQVVRTSGIITGVRRCPGCLAEIEYFHKGQTLSVTQRLVGKCQPLKGRFISVYTYYVGRGSKRVGGWFIGVDLDGSPVHRYTGPALPP